MSHILIADDDKLVVDLHAKAFEQAGYHVSKAYDGHEAINILIDEKPDLVLLDLLLPSIDGIGVLKFIRSRPCLRNLPVHILSSSSYFSGEAQSAWSAGATSFIQKGTLSPNAIVEKIGTEASPTKDPVAKPIPDIPIDYHRNAPETSPGIKKILIADDDRIIHGVLSFFLGQDGFKVESAFSGTQALQMARESRPSVLVLDISMPGMSGLETLAEWKSDPMLKDIPVIMLTASQDHENERLALSEGAASYLIKPFSPDSLVILANKLISR